MKKPLTLILLSVVVLSGLGVGAWYYARWRDIHTVPNLAGKDLKEAFDFIGTDEFAGWPAIKRQNYAIAAVDKMRDEPLDKLMLRLIKPDKDDRARKIAENMKKLPDREAIGSHIGEIFINKFYEQPPESRTAVLSMIAYAQQGEIGQHPERFILLSPEKLKSEMTKFVTTRSPHMQAMLAQFMVDLSRQRDALGLKDPMSGSNDKK